MEVYEAIRTRISVRDFKFEPVPDNIIRKMLSAARWAPSARNRQVKELLGIPADLELIMVMAFGYPTDAARAGGKRRKPLAQIAHSERLGQGFASS